MKNMNPKRVRESDDKDSNNITIVDIKKIHKNDNKDEWYRGKTYSSIIK